MNSGRIRLASGGRRGMHVLSTDRQDLLTGKRERDEDNLHIYNYWSKSASMYRVSLPFARLRHDGNDQPLLLRSVVIGKHRKELAAGAGVLKLVELRQLHGQNDAAHLVGLFRQRHDCLAF